jgi:hypothetical protein
MHRFIGPRKPIIKQNISRPRMGGRKRRNPKDVYRAIEQYQKQHGKAPSLSALRETLHIGNDTLRSILFGLRRDGKVDFNTRQSVRNRDTIVSRSIKVRGRSERKKQR